MAAPAAEMPVVAVTAPASGPPGASPEGVEEPAPSSGGALRLLLRADDAGRGDARADAAPMTD